ncbi:MAG TPA: type IV toxin-antitoxin system AbiEi family antitoxin [Bryobacteraceae bacterium]|nr:type IV toxin-antitoxin system AbiEi family antitoxin [Bryobacteraceae bacterium]
MRRHIISAESAAPSKTVGSRTAQLTTALYEGGQTTFTHGDVERITGLPAASARSLIRHAVNRGVVSRLEPGLFVLVPPELGRAVEFAGNPYLVVRQLVAGAEYFISHASAMELHRMVTQPQLVIFTSTTKRLRNRTIHGTDFRFVLTRHENVFGVTTHWISKQDSVKVSDIERTVIDGLHLPAYCGGVTEVAKGLWMRRDDVKPERLIEYARRLDNGAVVRRLGYLLERYSLTAPEELQRMRHSLSATYAVLDPTLPPEGTHVSGWRLRVNVSPDELEAVRRT